MSAGVGLAAGDVAVAGGANVGGGGSGVLARGTAVVGDSPQFSTIVARTAPRDLVGSALTLVNCIGFSITVVSLSLVQWLVTVLSLQYLLVVLAPGPILGLIAMRPLAAGRSTAEKAEMR